MGGIVFLDAIRQEQVIDWTFFSPAALIFEGRAWAITVPAPINWWLARMAKARSALPITPSPWWTSWSSIATAAPASPPPIDPAHCPHCGFLRRHLGARTCPMQAKEATMQAMVLTRAGAPLEWTELPDREPGPGEVRARVLACGVCRTDLHVFDGDLPNPKSPSSPATRLWRGSRPSARAFPGWRWGDRRARGWATPAAPAPIAAAGENLCDAPLFTGYTRDGGFATAVIADARFAFPLGEEGSDVALAPLLCRADRLAFAEDGGRGLRLASMALARRAYCGAGGALAGARVFAHPPGRHRS
jgi:hypothetical protein